MTKRIMPKELKCNLFVGLLRQMVIFSADYLAICQILTNFATDIRKFEIKQVILCFR